MNQTRMDTPIYIQALQRASKSPTIAHVVRLNLVCRWMKRKPSSLLYARIPGVLKVLVISDAAFRREDLSGLAMRGGIVCIAETRADDPGGRIQVMDFLV